MISKLIDTGANIEYGILIAVVLVALLLGGLAAIGGRRQLNVVSYLIGIVLVGLLTFQMSRLLGAFALRDAISTTKEIVGMFSTEVAELIPQLEGGAVGWFIFRRILWSVVWLGVGGAAIYVTMDTRKIHDRSVPRGAQMGRRGRQYNASTRRRR